MDESRRRDLMASAMTRAQDYARDLGRDREVENARRRAEDARNEAEWLSDDAARKVEEARETQAETERILRENERAVEENRRLLEELRAERAAAAMEADRLRDERLRNERAKHDAERAAERAAKVEIIRKRRAARRRVINRLIVAREDILATSRDAYNMLPIDNYVLDNAHPDEDSLPVNFITTHPEYVAWRNSPAYDEFLHRVSTGEEAEIGPEINI
jgi:hypothetical protein